MTVCNMSIEAGARAGMIAPDDVTFAYVEGRPHAPTGARWEEALADWRGLVTDDEATFDKTVRLDAASLSPHVTWGTNPAQVVPIGGSVPDPDELAEPAAREAAARALEYMGLSAGTPMHDDRGRHRLHRLVHELADRGPARGGRGPRGTPRPPAVCGRSWCPGRTGSRPRPRPRASTRSSWRRASSGASPVVRCAWR